VIKRILSTTALLLVLTTVVTVAGAHGAPAAPAGPCTDASAACLRSATDTYLDAVVSHEAANVRLAPDVRRTENGSVTGKDAAEIRKALQPPGLIQLVLGKRAVRYTIDVDHQEVVAVYLLDTGFPPNIRLVTSYVMERFRIENGLITEIEAVITVLAANAASSW
jgi:hypothetical protein